MVFSAVLDRMGVHAIDVFKLMDVAGTSSCVMMDQPIRVDRLADPGLRGCVFVVPAARQARGRQVRRAVK
jgi:hypothetical protein